MSSHPKRLVLDYKEAFLREVTRVKQRLAEYVMTPPSADAESLRRELRDQDLLRLIEISNLKAALETEHVNRVSAEADADELAQDVARLKNELAQVVARLTNELARAQADANELAQDVARLKNEVARLNGVKLPPDKLTVQEQWEARHALDVLTELAPDSSPRLQEAVRVLNNAYGKLTYVG